MRYGRFRFSVKPVLGGSVEDPAYSASLPVEGRVQQIDIHIDARQPIVLGVADDVEDGLDLALGRDAFELLATANPAVADELRAVADRLGDGGLARAKFNVLSV